jgi:hypothetical protein
MYGAVEDAAGQHLRPLDRVSGVATFPLHPHRPAVVGPPLAPAFAHFGDQRHDVIRKGSRKEWSRPTFRGKHVRGASAVL